MIIYLKVVNIKNFYKNKTIFVTGAAGSIGSETVKQLLKYSVKNVVCFDNNEFALFNLKNIMNDRRVKIVLGDIRNRDRLRNFMFGSDIVINCAAVKHVEMLEHNIEEAIDVNMIGLQNVISVTKELNIPYFLHTSSDKAVNPTAIYGMSKTFGEHIILNASENSKKTKFLIVRFGNVIASNGSVIPLWKNQISEGYVNITFSSCVRYFMSIHQAVNLILFSLSRMKNGEITILKMPTVRIQDLAEVMIKNFSNGKKIKINYIGMKQGEKIHEELMTDDESKYARDEGKVIILNKKIKTKKPIPRELWSSACCKTLSQNQIEKTLKEERII